MRFPSTSQIMRRILGVQPPKTQDSSKYRFVRMTILIISKLLSTDRLTMMLNLDIDSKKYYGYQDFVRICVIPEMLIFIDLGYDNIPQIIPYYYLQILGIQRVSKPPPRFGMKCWETSSRNLARVVLCILSAPRDNHTPPLPLDFVLLVAYHQSVLFFDDSRSGSSNWCCLWEANN